MCIVSTRSTRTYWKLKISCYEYILKNKLMLYFIIVLQSNFTSFRFYIWLFMTVKIFIEFRYLSMIFYKRYSTIDDKYLRWYNQFFLVFDQIYGRYNNTYHSRWLGWPGKTWWWVKLKNKNKNTCLL